MSSTLLNPYIMAAAGCANDTASGAQGGTGGSGWGLSGTSFPLGLGTSLLAGHALVGKTLNSISLFMQLTGSSGSVDMAAYHWAGSNHTYGSERAKSNIVTTTAMQSATSGGHVEFKWTFATPATVVAGDYISVDIPSSTGSGTNYTTEGSAFETNCKAQEYRGGWTQKTFGLRFTAEYNCPEP